MKLTRKRNIPTREEVAAIFERFRGAKSQLARELGVQPSAITNWLTGRGSQRIERAAQVRALELLTNCKDPEALCLPCPLRPLCTRIAKQGRKGDSKKSRRK